MYTVLISAFRRLQPPAVLAIGYSAYILSGWLLLCLPWAQTDESGGTAVDHLFTAASAVSTTGLVTIDPGSSYTLFGQIVLLGLIQAGGLGYMTFGSFIILSTGRRISRARQKVTQVAFPLPADFDLRLFLKNVVLYTFVLESFGAMVLSLFFYNLGIESPVWSGIFHSISAFCTAGFSLYSSSFIGFQDHLGINIVLGVLSIAGALGFIVSTDFWRLLFGRSQSVTITSKIIVTVSTVLIVMGTCVLALQEPSLSTTSGYSLWIRSFFQAMSASTTVGFNSIPIESLSSASLMALYFLMIFGASPSGTGGGLKSTTLTVIWSLIRGTVKGRTKITFLGKEIPEDRIRIALASFTFYFVILGLTLFSLSLFQTQSFEILLFECISALGTVGLSMGLTPQLSTAGKLLIIFLMFVGRLGVLTFGVAFSTRDDSECDSSTKSDIVV